VRVESPHEAITLYHHCDGYPTAMLPLMAQAFQEHGKRGFRSGRAGHVAAFLCATDPEGFEPEDSHELHGDIEWYYRLVVAEGRQYHDPATWVVSVYSPNRYDGTPEQPGKLILSPMDILAAGADSEAFEKAKYEDRE